VDARFDPHLLASEPFVALAHRLAEAVHATRGLPKWAIYHCLQVPGVVVGLALPAAAAPLDVRTTLDVPHGYDGLVPVSMVAAVPTVEAGTWHVYGLGALNGPAGRTLELAVTALGIRQVVGSVTWESPDLAAHLTLGPLEIITAWTPAHTDPATLTYRVEIGRTRPSSVNAERASATRRITCGHEAELRDLQAALESGARYQLVGAPFARQGRTSIAVEAIDA
jgi:hypothetical protein